MTRHRLKVAGIVGVIAAFSLPGVTAQSASADAFGEIGQAGSFGTASGQFSFPTDLAVDPADNSVYVLDEPEGTQPGVGPSHFRIQKFSASLGKPTASALIETPTDAKGHHSTVDGIAVDSSLHRLYVLKAIRTPLGETSGYAYVGSEIDAYSTTPTGETLPLASGVPAGVFYTFPAPPTEESKIPAGSLGTPDGLAVDPSTHDLIVLGKNASFRTVVQRIATTEPYSSGTLHETLEDTSNSLTAMGAANGVAVGPTGSIYLVTSNVPAGAGSSRRGIVKLTGSFATPTITVVHEDTSESPRLTGGSGSFGARDQGAQIAVSSDRSLVYAAQAKKLEEPFEEPKEPGNYEIRGMSTADGSQQILLGGGTSTCSITSASNAIAAGSNGVVYSLDEGNIEEGGGHTSFGFHLIEFGPGGSGCPEPAASFKMNGDAASPTVTVQRGQMVTFDASGSTLHGEKPVEVDWDLDGSGKYATKVTGNPANLTTSLRYLKPGTYTIGLKIVLEKNGNFGNPAPVTRTLHVEPSVPTAHFEASQAEPAAGETVTFNASESVDPEGGPEGEPTHKLKSYHWNFGDGTPETTTTTPEVSHAFANPNPESRSVTVELTVTSEEEQQSAPTTQMLSVKGTPAQKEPEHTVPPVEKQPLVTPIVVFDRSPTELDPKVVAGAGQVELTVTCPAAKVSCGGAAQLDATPKATGAAKKKKGKKPSPVMLGRVSFSLSSGQRQVLTVHLSSSGLALLKHEKTLKAQLILTAHDSFGDQKTDKLMVTLHAPTKKAPKK